MTIQHSLITDPDIHEPKGIASASVGKVYASDGAGSGAWVYPSGYAHGEIYIDAGVTTFTLPVSSGYAKLNPTGEWTSGVNNIVTLSPSTGEITLDGAGNYLIEFWATLNTTALASGTSYNFKYALDGVTSPRTLIVSKFTNGVDKLHLAASGLATVTAGQKLSIYAGGDATSSNTNITILEAGLTAIKLS